MTTEARVIEERSVWVLEFDGLPPSANHRLHWAQKAKQTQSWRLVAKLRAMEAQIPHMERIRISAVIRRSRIGIADEDNDRSRLKPIVDGIVDAGVLAKDTRGHVVWGTVIEERGPRGFSVTIERVEG